MLDNVCPVCSGYGRIIQGGSRCYFCGGQGYFDSYDETAVGNRLDRSAEWVDKRLARVEEKMEQSRNRMEQLAQEEFRKNKRLRRIVPVITFGFVIGLALLVVLAGFIVYNTLPLP